MCRRPYPVADRCVLTTVQLVAELFRSPARRNGWNDLPEDVTSAESLTTFFKTHLFRKSSPDYLLDINWLSPVDLAVVPPLKPPKTLFRHWSIDLLTETIFYSWCVMIPFRSIKDRETVPSYQTLLIVDSIRFDILDDISDGAVERFPVTSLIRKSTSVSVQNGARRSTIEFQTIGSEPRLRANWGNAGGGQLPRRRRWLVIVGVTWCEQQQKSPWCYSSRTTRVSN